MNVHRDILAALVNATAVVDVQTPNIIARVHLAFQGEPFFPRSLVIAYLTEARRAANEVLTALDTALADIDQADPDPGSPTWALQESHLI